MKKSETPVRISAAGSAALSQRSGKTLGQRFLDNWQLYALLLIPVVLTVVYKYIPMYGIQIAFKDFTPKAGIGGSPWVGFEHFQTFFNSFQVKSLFTNTISLSLYSLIAGFPFPIFLALAMNQIRVKRFKQTLQVATYLPHFISTVVMVGMLLVWLSPSSGLYGNLAKLFGVQEPPNILGMAGAFQSIYVWSDVWQHAGWDSIIYIAALAAVDPSLYEAATVDGAGKWQKIKYIDIPFLLPTAVILLIMRAGNIMNVGFEKVYLMQNPLNTMVSEIIATYVYKIGIQGAQYSYATAIGLFNNAINLALLLLVNWISKKLSDTSLL